MNGPVPSTTQTPTPPVPTAFELAEATLGPAPDGGLAALLATTMNQAQYDTQAGFLSALHGIDLGRLGLSQQNLALDRAGLGLSQEDIAAQLGFLGRKETLADQLLGNTQAGYGVDRSVAQLQNAIEQRDINNRAAAGGAWFSPETRLDRADSETALKHRLSQIDLQSQAAQLGRQGQQIDFDAAKYGLQSDEKKIGLDLQRLDTAASELGLDRQQLDLQLNNKLAMLGVDLTLANLEATANLGAEEGAWAQQVLDYALMLVMSGYEDGTTYTTMNGPVPMTG